MYSKQLREPKLGLISTIWTLFPTNAREILLTLNMTEKTPVLSPKRSADIGKHKKVHQIVMANPKVTLLDIPDTLNIIKERIGIILVEHLSIRKLFAK